MVAYVFRMPAGIPGEVNRVQTATITPESVTPSGTTGAPTAYGVPLVIDQTVGNVGNMRTVLTGDTAAVVYGFLVRPFPTQSYVWNDGLGSGAPPSSGQIDVLRRGCMTVLLSGTTGAVKGGQVYIWSAAPVGSHIMGGIEAANPGASGFALTNCFFRGAADAQGNIEIEWNL